MNPESKLLNEFIIMTDTTDGQVARRLGVNVGTVRAWRTGKYRTKFWRLNLIARRLADSDPVMAELCRQMAEALREEQNG